MQFFLFAYSLANTTSHEIRTKQLIYLLSFVPILISIQKLIKQRGYKIIGVVKMGMVDSCCGRSQNPEIIELFK